MQVQTGYIYHIKDDFFDKINDKRLMINHENGKTRPTYFTIKDKEIFNNKEILSTINHAKENNSSIHLLGLLSDGGVHSHIRHLYGLLEMAKRRDFEDVYVHCFLDGRDTPPASAEGYLAELEEKMQEKQIGKIASIS